MFVNHVSSYRLRLKSVQGWRCTCNITSYYDSQSGHHVKYSDAIQIHGFLHAPLEPHHVQNGFLHGVQGLDSITATSWKSSLLQLPMGIKTIYSCSADGGSQNTAISLSCKSPRASWDDAISLCMRTTNAGHLVKVTFQDVLSSDPLQVQLVTSLFADAGATILTIQTDDGMDADFLEEMYEAVTWSDVVGLPMKQRICIQSSNKALLAFAAMSLRIKHYDVCFQGRHGPLPETLVEVLSQSGLEHALKFKTAA
jgi:hypothetical protein